MIPSSYILLGRISTNNLFYDDVKKQLKREVYNGRCLVEIDSKYRNTSAFIFISVGIQLYILTPLKVSKEEVNFL